jgi:hypothetical protein
LLLFFSFFFFSGLFGWLGGSNFEEEKDAEVSQQIAELENAPEDPRVASKIGRGGTLVDEGSKRHPEDGSAKSCRGER